MEMSGLLPHGAEAEKKRRRGGARRMKMELQELVERIQRWRARQEGGTVPEPTVAAPPIPEAEPEAPAQAYSEEEPTEYGSEAEVEAVEPEDATSEVALEQIEEAD